MHDKMATKMPDGEDVLGMCYCPSLYGKDFEYFLLSVERNSPREGLLHSFHFVIHFLSLNTGVTVNLFVTYEYVWS